MLKRTFLHISGVGAKRELAIWRAGVLCWEDFIKHGEERLPPALYRLGLPVVRASLQAMESPSGLSTLAGMLPSSEHWRFYPHFGRVVYLDIESGGDPMDWDGLTVAGFYDGRDVTQYIAEKNLDEVEAAMMGYEIVTTFGGKSFDLPFLKRVFPGLRVPPVHIDLRWVLARLGYRGGLKRIERQLNIARSEPVRALEGFDAPGLWHSHLEGEAKALPLLLEYNAYDVINLAPLLDMAVKELRALLLGRI